MTHYLNNLFFRSIALRIFFLILIINTFTTFFLLFITAYGIEVLEETIILSDGAIELEHFKEFGDLDTPLQNSSAQMILAYQPKNLQNLSSLPIIFNNIPIPYKGEHEILGKEYFLVTEALPEGNFYLAKSFEAFERQEKFINIFVILASLGLFIINLFLAFFISKKISQPILSLAEDIQSLTLNSDINEKRSSSELALIAQSINKYHSQIREQNEREKQFLQIASHELRTPVSVIAGAAEIIQHRNALSAADKITLERIIHSAENMKDNITALLELNRNIEPKLLSEKIQLEELVNNFFQNYRITKKFDVERCCFKSFNNMRYIQANRSFVRVLLSNLLDNALAHSSGIVTINEQEKYIDIGEEGNIHLLKSALSHSKEFSDPKRSGLGLYIPVANEN
ncbi:MAG: HAMP domain-containing sensor histidine kinase [Pseudomonadota bacterium]